MNQDTFKDHDSDPGFLVAKGRFNCPSEHERTALFEQRDNLLRSGTPADSDEVVDLTKKIESMNKVIDSERSGARREHVKHLASAIFMAMTNHGYANVRAIGEAATYSAVKAITIASGYCRDKGVDIAFETCFDEGNLGVLRSRNHVTTVTAILFKLKSYAEREPV